MEKSEKTKSIWIILAVAACVICIVVALILMLKNKQDPDASGEESMASEYTESWNTAESETEEASEPVSSKEATTEETEEPTESEESSSEPETESGHELPDDVFDSSESVNPGSSTEPNVTPTEPTVTPTEPTEEPTEPDSTAESSTSDGVIHLPEIPF